jgi:hypothetical protein
MGVRAIVVLALGLGLAGCGSSNSGSTLSAPSPAAQPAPQTTATLSGLVFIETPTGRVPLVGVRIDEANSHRSARTGNDGLYSISGLNEVSDAVSASRWDVVTYTNTLTISGDTRLDIELPTYTLSGVVFERTPTGTAPIEGVEVYCDGCGSPYGHTFAYTDEDGFYSFSYTYSGTNPLIIRKSGYGDPAGQAPGPVQGSEWRHPMVNGDTRFDIELVRRSGVQEVGHT